VVTAACCAMLFAVQTAVSLFTFGIFFAALCFEALLGCAVVGTLLLAGMQMSVPAAVQARSLLGSAWAVGLLGCLGAWHVANLSWIIGVGLTAEYLWHQHVVDYAFVHQRLHLVGMAAVSLMPVVELWCAKIYSSTLLSALVLHATVQQVEIREMDDLGAYAREHWPAVRRTAYERYALLAAHLAVYWSVVKTYAPVVQRTAYERCRSLAAYQKHWPNAGSDFKVLVRARWLGARGYAAQCARHMAVYLSEADVPPPLVPISVADNPQPKPFITPRRSPRLHVIKTSQ